MKLVQTAITYPPAVGGLDNYLKQTSEGLVRRGHSVTVLTTDLEQPMSQRRVTIPFEYIDLAKVIRLPTRRIPKVGFPFATEMKSMIHRSDPDVIHAHCILHSSAVAGWRAARQSGVPFVVNTIFSPRSGIFWSLYRYLARKMISEAACVIAISDFERRLLASNGIDPSRVTILSPGIDLSRFKETKPSIIDRYGLEKNRIIVSLGRLAFGKRVDRLIQALPMVLRKHSDARVLVIGPDYGDQERLMHIAHSLGLNAYVVFAGPLNQDDVAAALQSSAVFAMTTDFELFGITLIEAMAAGVPVVAPNVASVPDVVREGETGLLYDHDSVDDLGIKLIQVLSDEKLRGHLIETAALETSTRFDFQKNLDQLEEIYSKATRMRK